MKCSKCGKKGLFLRVSTNGLCNDCESLQVRVAEQERLNSEISHLTTLLQDKQNTYNELYQSATNKALEDVVAKIADQNITIERNATSISEQENAISELQSKFEETNKRIDTSAKKLSKIKEHYLSMSRGIKKYYDMPTMFDSDFPNTAIDALKKEIDDLLEPTIVTSLHCMSVKTLRSEYKKNQKLITDILEQYRSRYTTKANATIYSLMVIGLSAELQNILSTLSYSKLNVAIAAVETMMNKYLQITTDGNKLIAPTIIKFLGEVEGLYINAINIEYEYYVQKELIKEEQRAIREQMRQEAEERKLLEQQRKQIEKEESKYNDEITKINEQLVNSADDEKTAQLQQRILELTAMLENVEVEKEKITSLQNGVAGNVYIISNLGSFGDNVFKVGMTRRLQPQERIDELGDASVPFRFDVHAMIFTDDAVELEKSLHTRLHEKRVNKINNRKEFFYSSVDELQEMVQELCPSAEFTTTMLAEQYRQSLSVGDIDFAEDIVSQNFSDDDE